MPSHSEANVAAAPLVDTVPEQNYDIITLPDASNNVQNFNEPRVSSRGRMKKLSRRLKDRIESGFSHDWIAFQSTF